MTLKEIAKILGANIVTNLELQNVRITHAFATDLLSELLKIDKSKTLLITGLATLQTVRASAVVDVSAILLVRNKKATDEMIELALQNRIIILEYSGSMFKASGILYRAGILPIF